MIRSAFRARAGMAAVCLALAPHPLAATEGGPALFVANKGEDSLMRIDLATGEETARVESCVNPHELALSPDGQHVALACYGGSTLEIYDSASLHRIKAIELGAGARPHGVIWHANGSLYATAEGRGAISIVDQPLSAEPEVSEIVTSTNGGPHLLAIDEAATLAWGTNKIGGEVVRVDLVGRRLTHRADFAGDPEAIALSPDGTALWVGANKADRAYRLDPATLAIEAEVATGKMPIRLQVHPGGAYAVTSEFGSGALSVIDSANAEIVRTMEVSGGPEAVQITLIFSPDGSRAYAAETGAGTVAEIDFASGKVLRRLKAGKGGDGLAVSE